MNAKLLHACLVLWLLGVTGMAATRALLELEPSSLPFRLAGALWVLGGMGYLGLGLLCLATESAGAAPRRNAPVER